MPKYSFIIPVYNAEHYLTECIDSILKQTQKDYEIILVDDGSTDNSPELCDELSINNYEVRTIHKKNGGASSARNSGLTEAKGDYVIFLDSDDYWNDENGLRDVDALTAPDVDVVVFPSMTLDDETGELKPDRYNYSEQMNSLGSKECLKYMIGHDLFNVHPGKRAIRRQFLLQNNLFFKEGIRAEDIEWYLRVALCFPNYRFLQQKLYVYRKREGSVTATVGGKHLSEHLGIIEQFSQWSYDDEQIKEYIFSYLAYSMSIVWAHIPLSKPQNAEELRQRIKNHTFLFNYSEYPRTRKIALFYKLFGFRATEFLLGWYLGRV